MRYFKPQEFACKHCGENKMDSDFTLWLDSVRHEFGRPMIVTSGYRCPEHNQKVSSTGPNGPHTTGKAVDIGVSGKDAYDLVLLAMQMGVKGIGINQKGASRFIHLDMSRPTNMIWSY
jgi:uncharacterized protein YcbK (DUF882 family)